MHDKRLNKTSLLLMKIASQTLRKGENSMNDFENLKQGSYNLIAEFIEKLLNAKDMQVDVLANQKATKILNDITDKAHE